MSLWVRLGPIICVINWQSLFLPKRNLPSYLPKFDGSFPAGNCMQSFPFTNTGSADFFCQQIFENWFRAFQLTNLKFSSTVFEYKLNVENRCSQFEAVKMALITVFEFFSKEGKENFFYHFGDKSSLILFRTYVPFTCLIAEVTQRIWTKLIFADEI